MWWQEGVIYQIYPRSFQDSNGDGIGDLQGLIQRLDYLNDGTPQSLGVDAIWLSPFFPSPMHDFGYDISDYCAIDPVFGDMDDFDQLLAEAHRRNIRLILDLVVNHTSDEHPWFRDSCTPGSAKADWYLWHEGKTPPNNWLGAFGGKGWTFHPQRGAWYYHSFLPQQPDLNWRNPAVRAAVRDIMAFWLDKGVDGFRLDVVNLYVKDARLRDNPTHWFRIARPYDRQHHQHDRDQQELHAMLHEMRRFVDRWPQRMLVGEIMLAPDGDSQLPATYYGDNDELHLAFNFEFLHCDFSASAFRDVIARWSRTLGASNWPDYTLSNHDFPRHASRHRGPQSRERLRLLAMMLLTLRGTPFLYYGEEIGMPEQPVARRQMKDPVGLRYWPLHPGRDGCRRPMMWSQDPDAFSEGNSWLPNDPLACTNVEDQQSDPDSLLSWYRTLIHTRKAHAALHKGELRLLECGHDVLGYERHEGEETVQVLLNFSMVEQAVTLSGTFPDKDSSLLLNSQNEAPQRTGNALRLAPLQGVVVRAKG
ncbi:alpha-amylase family glycosyl hydrolase [Thalassolituus sp. LLYu03]|uniref:alpha-amylase family glycosyl hydrolase n=1 Tax=Thalassolituus sp. LLYu03 TaxID=3421656 RepID=UPI003D29E8B8